MKIKLQKILKSDISIKRKSSKSLNSQIFTNLQKHYRFNAKAGNFNIALNIKNIFDEEWKADEIKLECNEKDSTIKFSQVINFPFDLPKGQDNDFTLVFNEEEGTYRYKGEVDDNYLFYSGMYYRIIGIDSRNNIYAVY